MTWIEVLNSRTKAVYHATVGLAKLVSDKELSWKPATGSNWMTTGQLLDHLTNAGGTCIKGFVTGDWGMPAGAEMNPDDMLPPAEKLPAAKSVADAVRRIEADEKLALDMIAKAGEKDLGHRKLAAPWDPTEKTLGQHCFEMIDTHLGTHKAQLFYYLKLMGKPVHTGNLYGM
jgi:hypothetical protein